MQQRIISKQRPLLPWQNPQHESIRLDARILPKQSPLLTNQQAAPPIYEKKKSEVVVDDEAAARYDER